jgi:hypothetical protein
MPAKHSKCAPKWVISGTIRQQAEKTTRKTFTCGAFLYDHALAMVLHVGFVHKSLKRFVLQDLPDIC